MISEQEAQIYDRQIRLWGLKTQQRMSKSRVLVYGMTGLAVETCKNLVLSGLGNVCIMDSENVTMELLGANFFVTEQDVGKNRALASRDKLQELNPLIQVTALAKHIDAVDAAFFDSYDVVILCNCNLQTQMHVNDICHKKGILFFAGQCLGMLAYLFVDMLEFDYEITDKETKKVTPKKASFVPLSAIFAAKNWSSLKRPSALWLALQIWQTKQDRVSFLQAHQLNANLVPEQLLATIEMHSKAEINPVCAIMGGLLAQEVLKALSRDAEPICNYLVYDGLEMFGAFVEHVTFKK